MSVQAKLIELLAEALKDIQFKQNGNDLIWFEPQTETIRLQYKWFTYAWISVDYPSLDDAVFYTPMMKDVEFEYATYRAITRRIAAVTEWLLEGNS